MRATVVVVDTSDVWLVGTDVLVSVAVVVVDVALDDLDGELHAATSMMAPPATRTRIRTARLYVKWPREGNQIGVLIAVAAARESAEDPEEWNAAKALIANFVTTAIS